MKKSVLLLSLLLFSGLASLADVLDSNYVLYYKHRFVLSYFQSYRNYELTFQQRLNQDTLGISTEKFLSNASHVSGFGFDFDKISFSFAKKTPLSEQEIKAKGKTSTYNYGASYTDNHFRIEGFVRQYKGLYDVRTVIDNDTSINTDDVYYQKPSMKVNTIKLKAFYFVNKKDRFSFMSSYGSTQRQLITAGSFFVMSNLYYHSIGSLTPILSNESRKYYGRWDNLNQLKLSGLSICPGYSFNLVVFKRFFLNVTLAYGPDFLYRNYLNETDQVRKDEIKLSASGEIRNSFGYNGPNFFLFVAQQTDFLTFKNKELHIDSRYISGSLTMGWRFKTRKNGPLNKLKENKWYMKI